MGSTGPTPIASQGGRHALLLTDVVDSTKLSEQLGDAAMAALWERHDRIARDLLREHGGREIDKTDGFLLLFDRAADAVAYAMAYHHALGPLGIAARAGLHVGVVILRENAPDDVARGAKPLEVEGLAKPFAARVMSVAGAGQTLLSAQAQQALGTDLPFRVQSHGHWRMKGVSEPVELFEVGGDDAPFTPPPDAAKVYRVVRQPSAGPGVDLWLPVREVRHGLPAERDPFVGRAADLLDLAERVEAGARLVSVLGIGGSGKTRLATRYAWTWLGDWPGGAWFCDLSEARSAEGVAASVARALDVALTGGDPVAQLGHAIAGRGRCLLILDNFEQVAAFAEETLGRWLDRAADAVFVVTTREVLGLSGETALALAPLGESDGIALFTARAVQARRDFKLTDADRPHVRELVRLLDGLPLAIELAAARVRVMPPKTLQQRMSERFKLLASAGGRHARQSTLRATLDWSWELLTPDEQAGLAQLSVFEGGFTLEAAEAVLDVGDAWPMDVVQALVDKSLVRQVSAEDAETARFDLLLSVHEYAAEHLGRQGGVEAVQARHGSYFADTWGSPETAHLLHGHGGADLRRTLALERDNLQIAAQRAVLRKDPGVAPAAFAAMWQVVDLQGPYAPVVALADAILGLDGLDARSRAAVQFGRGVALNSLGRVPEARVAFEAMLAAAVEAGDVIVEIRARSNLGIALATLGSADAAVARFEEALTLARSAGDPRSEGYALGNLGMMASRRGDANRARELCLASIALLEAAGDQRFVALSLMNLGTLAGEPSGVPIDHRHFRAALALARTIGDRRVEGLALGNLGLQCRYLGQLAESVEHLAAALVIHQEMGNRRFEGHVLTNLADGYLVQGHLARATALLDAALIVQREVGDREFERATLRLMALARLRLGDPEEAARLVDASADVPGSARHPPEPARLACVRARVALARGDRDGAEAALADAEARRDALAQPDARLDAELDEARAAVRGA